MKTPQKARRWRVVEARGGKPSTLFLCEVDRLQACGRGGGFLNDLSCARARTRFAHAEKGSTPSTTLHGAQAPDRLAAIPGTEAP